MEISFVTRCWNVIRVCCVSIGERSVMEYNNACREKMRKTAICWKWIAVIRMNIDVRMECAFRRHSSSMANSIVSIGQMKCHSRRVRTVSVRAWMQNVLIIHVHRRIGRVVMDNVFPIDWPFRNRHPLQLVGVVAHVSVKRRPAASECALCFIQTHWDAISPNFSPKCVCMRFESYTNASSCVLWTCWNASQICMRFNAFCSFSEAS